ncbi:hypothetical protein D3C79_843840 [compost metagenome]
MLFQPDRLIDGGGAGQYFRPRGLDPRQQAGLGQAEMEADHGGFERFDQLAGGVVERRAVGYRRRRLEIGVQLLIVRFERLLPGGIARRIGLRRLVAEKIDIQRPTAGLAEGLQFGANLLQAQGCTRQ